MMEANFGEGYEAGIKRSIAILKESKDNLGLDEQQFEIIRFALETELKMVKTKYTTKGINYVDPARR